MTRKAAYYNEFDPNAAAWLRELIARDLIAPGDVDTRSIRDVRPDDLRGYAQCHFFAGIGVWSYALRRAGWADDRPVWSGSCPCQPFSNSGELKGFEDPRHLWPDFFRLIAQCRPEHVVGEQVATANGLAWLDLVSTDMEGAGYAVGAVDTPAAGFGSPHARQRLYWLGVPNDTVWRADLAARHERDGPNAGQTQNSGDAGSGRKSGGLDDQRVRRREPAPHHPDHPARPDPHEAVALADHDSDGPGQAFAGLPVRNAQPNGSPVRPGPTSGFWQAADWLSGRDGKWRPVEPGTFPLAHGAPARVGRLRGYGNAIVGPQAAAFCEVVMELVGEARS